MSKRIIDQPVATSLSAGDYVMVDNQAGGSKKFDLKTELSGIKEDLQELIDSGGGGLTTEFKQALYACISHIGAWTDEHGQEYIGALYDVLFNIVVTNISLNTNSLSFGTLNSTQQLTATTTPTGGNVTWTSSNPSVATVSSTGLVTSVGYGNATITATSGSVSATCSVVVEQATLSSISAAYTQSGTVYDTDTLDSLKTDLVVTATWSDSSTSTVASTDYTLSGTLTEGTSTITVSYGGKTTTFNVTVSEVVIPPLYDWNLKSSLTDTVASKEATTSATFTTGVGLVFDTYNTYAAFEGVAALGRTYELDVVSVGTIASAYKHRRMVRFYSAYNNAAGPTFAYNYSNGKWQMYTGTTWDAAVFEDSSLSSAGCFDGKTVKIHVDSSGYMKVYTKTIGASDSTYTLVYQSATAVSNYYANLYIGASAGNDSIANATFSGLRIYEGEK